MDFGSVYLEMLVSEKAAGVLKDRKKKRKKTFQILDDDARDCPDWVTAVQKCSTLCECRCRSHWHHFSLPKALNQHYRLNTISNISNTNGLKSFFKSKITAANDKKQTFTILVNDMKTSIHSALYFSFRLLLMQIFAGFSLRG